MTTHAAFARHLIALVLAYSLAFGAQSAFAQTPAAEETSSEGGSSGGGGDNLALAVNTKDNSSVVKFAFQVRRVMNGVVDQTNAAVAVASCNDCTTIAVAIQVVMVVNDADVVTPTNLALAYNVACTSCETLASAYQYVFSTDGAVRFTTEGWRTIVDIRNQVRDLLKDDTLDIATLQTELDALMDQLREVVSTQLEAAPGPKSSEETTDGSTEEEGDVEGSTEGTPAPEQTTEEDFSPTPEPEPSEEEASPSPSS